MSGTFKVKRQRGFEAVQVIMFASAVRRIDFTSINLSGLSLASTNFLHTGFDPSPEVWQLSCAHRKR